jgi:hypothetical protein
MSRTMLEAEPPMKKQRLNYYHDSTQQPNNNITFLSQDEVSNILDYLPIGNKLMLSCTSKGFFQLIDTLVRQQFPGYEDSVPLVQIWLKYNEYTVQSQKDFDTLRTRLERAGSFSGVTQRLVIDFDYDSSDDPDLNPELKAALEILSIPTGRTIAVKVIENAKTKTVTKKIIPELIGHTLKHCLIIMTRFCFKLLNLICNVESLELGLSKMKKFEAPEYSESLVLSNLKRLQNGCELSISFQQYMSRLVPNLETLDLSQLYGKFPRCYVDNCPNIQEISSDNDNEYVDVDDEDLLYMVEHLTKLRKLDIVSSTMTGSAFEQFGKYAHTLEYLRIYGKSISGMEWNANAGINGGQLPALKQFSFNGSLYLDDEGAGYNAVGLFNSVIRNCPNINQITIWDDSIGHYPSNLYGLVPVENISELTLYSSLNKSERPSKNRAITLYTSPGSNVLDTITNMNQNWKEIAQSNFVKIVTMYEIPSVEVLQRCKWINAHTLKLESWSGMADNFEWFKALTNSLPNIRHLICDNNEFPVTLQTILCCSNEIWPDLIECNISIPDGLVDAVAASRPEFQYRQKSKRNTKQIYLRKYAKWESQWLREWKKVF